MSPITARCGSMPGLRSLLERHPGISLADDPIDGTLEFDRGTWHRRVDVGSRQELSGLVELVDNNPMVCADAFSVPDAGATLALIALGPLARAGLIVERPSLVASFVLDENSIDAFVGDAGWQGGVSCHFEDQPIGSVVALNAFALITTPADLAEVDELYEEALGRSFYVRRMEEGEWDVDLVEGKPHAAYRLRVTVGDPHSLLTIQVMSDREGKAGAAQVVHAMNVMAGFEESLGVS